MTIMQGTSHLERQGATLSVDSLAGFAYAMCFTQHVSYCKSATLGD